MSDKQQPAHKVDQYWPITGSIWANRSRSKNDLYFTFTVQRSYRDASGDYRAANSFSADDCKALQETITACWHWIMTSGREQIRQSKQDNGDSPATATT